MANLKNNTNFKSELLERYQQILNWEKEQVEGAFYPFYKQYDSYENGRVTIDGQSKLMTASSSYLGLSEKEQLVEKTIEAINNYGFACHGSRVLSGSKDIHTKMELEIADFLGADSALVYPNGWLTNYTILKTILTPDDIVATDKKNHNCIAAGIQASGARVVNFKANNPESLARVLRKKQVSLVVFDAVFSMDGDIAPLPKIVDICKEHGVMIMIDEAQSIGVLGDSGRGIVEHFGISPSDVDIRTGTMSKVLCSSGGFVAASEELTNILRLRSEGYIFTGAPSVINIAPALASLQILRDEPHLVKDLQKRCDYFRSKLLDAKLNVIGKGTPIIPVVYNSEEIVFRLIKELFDQGFFVSPAIYPAVPKKTPRIRFNITNSMSFEDIDELASSFIHLNKNLDIIDLRD